jgi:hypothetical protein
MIVYGFDGFGFFTSRCDEDNTTFLSRFTFRRQKIVSQCNSISRLETAAARLHVLGVPSVKNKYM